MLIDPGTALPVASVDRDRLQAPGGRHHGDRVAGPDTRGAVGRDGLQHAQGWSAASVAAGVEAAAARSAGAARRASTSSHRCCTHWTAAPRPPAAPALPQARLRPNRALRHVPRPHASPALAGVDGDRPPRAGSPDMTPGTWMCVCWTSPPTSRHADDAGRTRIPGPACVAMRSQTAFSPRKYSKVQPDQRDAADDRADDEQPPADGQAEEASARRRRPAAAATSCAG